VRVKLQHNLQPHEQKAHSIVIEDDAGNPIFVALQLDESIVYADAREPDFHAMLRAAGVDKTVAVTEVRPKPMQNLLWTP
jgi:hypothetical protein